MSTLSHYLLVFAFGGALCVPAQILIDKTRLTPARILVIYVVVGVLLGGVGLYEPLVGLFGSGARRKCRAGSFPFSEIIFHLPLDKLKIIVYTSY